MPVTLCCVKVDFFAVDAVNLDDVERLIIGHDGKESGSGWFLDKVVVYSPYERGLKMFTFDCNRSTCIRLLSVVLTK